MFGGQSVSTILYYTEDSQ